MGEIGSNSNEISAGETLTISGGQTSDGLIVDGGGFLIVDNGGTATNAAVSGNETISAGGTDSAAVVALGGVQDVLGGVFGVALAGGQQIVEAGGFANGTVISAGGSQTISAAGSAAGTTIDAGGLETLSGTDSGAQISGGEQDVFGSANGATIYAGSQVVATGAAASGTTIVSGGLEIVSGTDTGALISGGEQDVWGNATSATIYTGSQVVEGGGTANATTIMSGGLESVSGTDTGAVISGGEQDVFWSATNVTIQAGSQVVETLGSALSTTISGGGTEVVSGFDSGTQIRGGTQLDYGSTSNVYVSSGTQTVEIGGTATATTVSGVAGSYAGVEDVFGSTSGTTVLFGGAEFVETGGTAINTLDSGLLLVSGGATASNTTVFSSGTETVYGTEFGARLSGGELDVFGSASGTTILSGGREVVSSGASDLYAQINAGGREFLYANARAVDTIIYGTSSFTSGGVTPITPPPAGSGASPPPPPVTPPPAGSGSSSAPLSPPPTPTPPPPGASGPGAADPINGIFVRQGGTITISGGQDFYAGATASGATLSGGFQYVASGAIASTTTIRGGIEYIDGGAVATDTLISGGILWLASGGTASGAIDFAGSGGTLQIDGTSMPANTVSGFVAGDMFDLAGVAYSSTGSADLLAGNMLQISEGAQTYDLQLDPHQDFTGDYFHLGSDAGSGTQVTEDDIPCYCAGTLIATVHGDVRVEELAIGDEVLTLDGAARPIKWIGRRSYQRPFMGRNVTPILIRAGALREDVPLRDLYVSPDHALYVDEVLIAAEHLVNGVSIVRCQDVDSVQYIHIELDRHDVIFAEGAPAETFVDCDNRSMFHNAAEFTSLYPADAAPGWAFCAPRIDAGPRLERIRQAIAERAGLRRPEDPTTGAPLDGSLDDVSHTLINGWAFDPSQPGVAVWLEVLVDDGLVGRVLADLHRPDLEHGGIADGHHGFALWLQHGLSPLTPHVVRVRRVGDGCELPGSPRLLEARESATVARGAELLRALQAAAHAAPDVAALDGMLWSLHGGIERVRKIRAERQLNTKQPLALLARANGEPNPTRRALVIDDRLPDATRDAGSNAILGHMRALIALGYAVEFVPAKETISEAAPHVPGFDAVRWHAAPAITSVEDVLRRNAGAYELIYLHRLSNALAYAGLSRQWCPRAHVLYSVADLHHLRLERQGRVLGETKLLARARALKQAEFLAMRTADAVITHSPAEAAYLARETPGARVHVVGWPVTIAPRNVRFGQRAGVAFIGSADHDPNRDAVLWLINEIMPRVWECDAGVICEIVGAGWPAVLKQNLDRRIRIVGPVADLAAVFDRVRLTVAPLRFGAGIKGKVLESFAAGVPCVMTSVAAEGLPLSPGLRRLVGDTRDQIANLICHLHGSARRNATLGRAGMKMVADAFAFARVRDDLRAATERRHVSLRLRERRTA
jgi:autotransporter passenger strand-loop-strand repeat protein